MTGAEGVFHCGLDTAVTRVDDRPVAGAALLGEGGLVVRCSGVWILYRRDEDPVEIAVPDGVVLAWGGDRSGVLALISGEEGRRLVRVEEVSTTPIFTTWPSPTIDAAGTVWILADGLRSIPTVSMAWPPLLDVAALLEAAVPLRE